MRLVSVASEIPSEKRGRVGTGETCGCFPASLITGFSPSPSADVPGLRASLYIESLQREAQRALQEVLQPLHPEDRGRFAHVLLITSTLKSIPPALITDLFFRPVIGNADIVELIAEMLYEITGRPLAPAARALR